VTFAKSCRISRFWAEKESVVAGVALMLLIISCREWVVAAQFHAFCKFGNVPNALN
jgi:hypothetical protein